MTPSHTINAALTQTFETLINQGLKYDPGTRGKLTALDGRQLALISESPALTLYFYIADQYCHVSHLDSRPSDVTLNGNLLDLINVGLKGEQTLANSGVQVSGRIGVLQEFQQVFQSVEIDWEEPLSDFFGPVVGHSLSQFIRGTSRWASGNLHTIKQNLPDLLSEELQLIPHSLEITTFANDVDQIRSQVTRLNARIMALRAQLTQDK